MPPAIVHSILTRYVKEMETAKSDYVVTPASLRSQIKVTINLERNRLMCLSALRKHFRLKFSSFDDIAEKISNHIHTLKEDKRFQEVKLYKDLLDRIGVQRMTAKVKELAKVNKETSTYAVDIETLGSCLTTIDTYGDDKDEEESDDMGKSGILRLVRPNHRNKRISVQTASDFLIPGPGQTIKLVIINCNQVNGQGISGVFQQMLGPCTSAPKGRPSFCIALIGKVDVMMKLFCNENLHGIPFCDTELFFVPHSLVDNQVDEEAFITVSIVMFLHPCTKWYPWGAYADNRKLVTNFSVTRDESGIECSKPNCYTSDVYREVFEVATGAFHFSWDSDLPNNDEFRHEQIENSDEDMAEDHLPTGNIIAVIGDSTACAHSLIEQHGGISIISAFDEHIYRKNVAIVNDDISDATSDVDFDGNGDVEFDDCDLPESKSKTTSKKKSATGPFADYSSSTTNKISKGLSQSKTASSTAKSLSQLNPALSTAKKRPSTSLSQRPSTSLSQASAQPCQAKLRRIDDTAQTPLRTSKFPTRIRDCHKRKKTLKILKKFDDGNYV